MSNVKPGDLARLIRDDHAGNGGDNFGKQCVVLVATPEPASPFDRLMLSYMRRKYGQQLWDVQTLEPFWIAVGDLKHRTYGKAGDILTVPDACLRRIEPPSDVADVFSTTKSPTDSKESANANHSPTPAHQN